MKRHVIFVLFLMLSFSLTAEQRRFSFTPYRILRAFETAYPEKVRDISFKNGDWTINLDGEVFYWAEGRLLPRELRGDMNSYSPYPFYRYSKDYNPPIPLYSGEEKQDLKNWFQEREDTPVNRYPDFYNRLFGMYDKDSAQKNVEWIDFLNYSIEIHKTLVLKMEKIESNLLKSDDPEVGAFISSIKYMAGFNWRPIAGTSTLSNHSYGTAVDIVPRDYHGKQVYWRWFRVFNSEWFTLPWEERHKPPETVVREFEKEGFIWGGKWLFFDGMHFEYRPEILILNGIQ